MRQFRSLHPVFVTVLCTAALATAPAAALASGASVSQSWSPINTANFEQLIVPQATPVGTFVALQANTNGTAEGDSYPGFYVGLQNTSAGRLVIFSFWNANSGYGYGCQPFPAVGQPAVEGHGWQCLQPYAFEDGHPYTVHVQRQHNDGVGTWWDAKIVDENGTSTYIAALREPGGPSIVTSSYSFVEHFGAGCEQPARAFFLPPKLLDWGVYSGFSGDPRDNGSCVPAAWNFGYGGISMALGGG